MYDLRRIRPLDAAIALTLALVVGLAAYLGYTVWRTQREVEAATPAARSLNELIAAVRRNPDDLGLRLRLARAFAALGRRDEAIRQYRTVLKVDEENAPALAGLGEIALSDREWRVAEGYLRRAVEIYTRQTPSGQNSLLEQAYYYLGTALMEQKEYEEAASYFKAALRIKRDSSMTHYLLAVCLRELGLMDAYRESLENALLFDPKHPEANYDYGQLLLDEGDVAGAAEHFRRSADAAPTVPLPRQALERLGRAEERINAARRLLPKDPKRALVEARIAVALDPRSAEALVVLGDCRAALGQAEAAEDAYRRALGIDPANEAATAGLRRVSDGS